ncbi:SAM-dependent methyltransferase [Nemania sp. NC0429]|nr:SAM-dependent methyltransferase [Nemania sp. NC0429]
MYEVRSTSLSINLHTTPSSTSHTNKYLSAFHNTTALRSSMTHPTASESISADLAPSIATYSPHVPGHIDTEVAQARHRIRLVNLWHLEPGTRVLELGCGQGTATAVLAEAVGASGHVDAVDPGAPDYGAPFTLAQAQQHLSASPVGGRIAWHRATPQDFLSATDAVWDVAVLAHCIWYFASEQELEAIVRALHGRVKRLCVAEYALHAAERAAVPHVLAILARGSLESFKDESIENVRSPLSPSSIKKVATRAGWNCTHESSVVPEPGLLDGFWEVGTVLSDGFLREVSQAVSHERMRVVVTSARDAVASAVSALDGAKVRTMDVWVAAFSRG